MEEGMLTKDRLEEIKIRSYFAAMVSAKVAKDLLTHIAISEERCHQCFADNDSRKHLDICESCEIQNKMNALKNIDR